MARAAPMRYAGPSLTTPRFAMGFSPRKGLGPMGALAYTPGLDSIRNVAVAFVVLLLATALLGLRR